MQWEGLNTLARAATLLEKRVDHDIQTEREKRKMQAYLRRFEAMEQQEMRQLEKASVAAARERPSKRVKSQTAHALLGKIVWKEFKDQHGRRKMYQGEVVSVCYTKKGKSVFNFARGVTSTVKFLVEYSDGDSEDMTETDVLKYMVV
jgi:hypothetical protein